MYRGDVGGGAECSFKLLTGGYDDTLRLRDVRSIRRCVDEVVCGGGVWRIKEDQGVLHHGRNPRTFLLGYMYDGFKLESVGSDYTLSVVAFYNEHKPPRVWNYVDAYTKLKGPFVCEGE